MIDRVAALGSVLAEHDWREDGETALGTFSCKHWGSWADDFRTLDLVALGSAAAWEVNPLLTTALALLASAEVPESWKELAEALPGLEPTAQSQGVRSLRAALNGHFAELLIRDQHDQLTAKSLAYTFEAMNFLDDWVTSVDNDFNYIPQWGIQNWINSYLRVINLHSTLDDLRTLSRVTGDRMCITEAWSVHPDPSDVVAVQPDTDGTYYSVAPNLPAEFVNRRLAENSHLLFHPNADLDLSWAVLEVVLREDPDLALELMSAFQNIRDDGWPKVLGYAISGPLAEPLRQRISEWCDEDPDNRMDILEEILAEAGLDGA